MRTQWINAARTMRAEAKRVRALWSGQPWAAAIIASYYHHAREFIALARASS